MYIYFKMNVPVKYIYDDISGKLVRKYSPKDVMIYKIKLLFLYTLILTSLILCSLRRIPYIPITILETTIYARVSAAILKSFQIPYIIGTNLPQSIYYTITNGYEVPLAGLNYQSALPLITPGPFLPHSSSELEALESHTGLKLDLIEQAVLHRHKELTLDFLELPNKPVMIHYIKRIYHNLIYVQGTEGCWFTTVILTDKVNNLLSGEVVVTGCQKTEDLNLQK